MRKRNADFVLRANSAVNGGNVNLHSNASNINSAFRETDRGNNFFSYERVNSRHSIDGGIGGATNQNVYVWSTGANNFNQHWRRVGAGRGSFTLRKRNSQSFGINGGGTIQNFSNVNLHPNLANANTHWFIR